MIEEKRILKNKQISETKKTTIDRHKSMDVKTFCVKIQENRLTKEQRYALETVFLEQKWYKNYILNWLEANSENKLKEFNTKLTNITKKDKNLNDIDIKIKFLSAQSRQCLVSRMIANLKTMKTLRNKGLQKYGKLRFSKEEFAIDLKQYGVSHRILTNKRIKIAGLPKTFIVNGVKQFKDIQGIEIANARLLHKGGGYYVQFVCYIPKTELKSKIDGIIGIDFGCSTTLTLSNGDKFSVKIPESERLKKCQKNQARKQKGSKNWHREVEKVRKAHQKILNKKNDLANKIVAKICQFETVVIQDEQLSNWHKNSHSKAIQYSILGRVKSKLKQKPNVRILNKFLPTTKLCTNCGKYHDKITQYDRVFKCDCGVNEDRDIHAAKNMIWFYKNVGVERANFKRAEMKALVASIISANNQLLSEKHEADTF